MKKIFAIIAVCMIFAATTSAQDQAIGIRFGGGSYNGGEISYQKVLSDANRVEFDLGFIGNKDYTGISLTGIYQWTWALDDLGEGFGWYAGVGGGIRMFNGIGIGLNGQIGIEYTLPSIPLKFSLDTRPGWYFGNEHGSDLFAVGVRYLF